MSKTIYNTVAVVVSRVWSLGIGILLLPIYASILGYEAFGLVGFYTTLQSALMILDLGLSATMSRELARSKASPVTDISMPNLAFTIEVIYWFTGIILGLLVVIFAPYIAAYWVKPKELSIETVTSAVQIMGIILAFQWPQSIYNGGLTGLQKLVTLNTINVIFNTIKSLGVILALKFISPSIQVFFYWQLMVVFLMTLVLRYYFWGELKGAQKPIFSKNELKRIWRFAAGMTGISLASLLLGQMDKIVLSKILPLQEYGYYILAFTAGASVLIGVGIFLPTFLPKLSELVAKGIKQDIADCYHTYSNIIATVAMPPALVMCLFSKEILLLWTHNVDVAQSTWPLVSFVSIGYLFNGLNYGAYYLMLAYGWTRYTIYQNIICSILAVPLLYFGVTYFGLTGGASISFILAIGIFATSLPIVHRTLLKGELKNVYLKDIGIPLIATLAVVLPARIFFPSGSSMVFQIGYLGCTLILPLVLIIWVTPKFKQISMSVLLKIKTLGLTHESK